MGAEKKDEREVKVGGRRGGVQSNPPHPLPLPSPPELALGKQGKTLEISKNWGKLSKPIKPHPYPPPSNF